MSKKKQLKDATEEIKKWAIDNTAPPGLHTLIQKLNEEIDTLGDDDFTQQDPGGNNPTRRPPLP